MTTKKKVYPNEYFQSVDEYVNFAIKHQVFGAEALALKKNMNKKVNLIPRIYPHPKKEEVGG